MTRFRYLELETVLAINAEHGGRGAGVRDPDGLQSALGRAEAGFAGKDVHERLVDKAAAILHGIATTQTFLDGNKRTAWLTAKFFLALNGHHLRKVSTVEAEFFVMAVATRGLEARDGVSGALSKIAQWFEAMRLTASDRVAYAMLAEGLAQGRDGRITKALGMDLDHLWLGPRAAHYVAVYVNLRLYPVDAGREHTVDVEFDTRLTPHRLRIDNPRERVSAIVPKHAQAPDPRNPGRLLPISMGFGIPFKVRPPASVNVKISLNGELAHTLPLTVEGEMPTVPDVFIP